MDLPLSIVGSILATNVGKMERQTYGVESRPLAAAGPDLGTVVLLTEFRIRGGVI